LPLTSYVLSALSSIPSPQCPIREPKGPWFMHQLCMCVFTFLGLCVYTMSRLCQAEVENAGEITSAISQMWFNVEKRQRFPGSRGCWGCCLPRKDPVEGDVAQRPPPHRLCLKCIVVIAQTQRGRNGSFSSFQGPQIHLYVQGWH
jgi:hypothetical protein